MYIKMNLKYSYIMCSTGKIEPKRIGPPYCEIWQLSHVDIAMIFSDGKNVIVTEQNDEIENS